MPSATTANDILSGMDNLSMDEKMVKSTPVASVDNEIDTISDDKNSESSPKEHVSLKYVFVPADLDLPIKECTWVGPEPELGNDGFTESLKVYFGSLGKGIDKDKLLEGLTQHAGKENVDKLTPGMLSQIMDTTQLDIFPMLMPTDLTKKRGISVYVDDKGVSKDQKEVDNHLALEL